MPASSLIALIDDIATVLDDVAILSKVAAKKTAGVLGDDLALNAEQVSGVRAEREIPVVWAVAKGSFLNKVILVPAALAISAILPQLILPLLMLGGIYLCFEGFEKVAEWLFHGKAEENKEEEEILQVLTHPEQDMVEFEKQKIKGAIRTDFILSAEIIVIALGTVKDADLITQAMIVSLVAAVLTAGVYGLVAAIVKLDDAGFYLIKSQGEKLWARFKRSVGRGLLIFAPFLMKLLSVAGTIAMFLVGGSILLHGIPAVAPILHHVEDWAGQVPVVGGFFAIAAGLFVEAIFGLLAGGLALLLISIFNRLKPQKIKAESAE